jgi:hypothetical protein
MHRDMADGVVMLQFLGELVQEGIARMTLPVNSSLQER